MISADKTHHMPRALQRARHMLAAVGIVLLCIACGQPRPDPTIPIPSAAQAVQRAPGPRQIVHFTIDQTPEQVVAWYKQQLLPQGWSVNLEVPSALRPIISFSSSAYRILFVLDIIAEQRPNGVTSVEVELKPQPPA
ncbi:MAG: hypothetical protein JST60_20510 [Chloroflexi bacterium SZAS-1]|nr:hypothetical protein [Chloroflexi bacterium SZAS-1]